MRKKTIMLGVSAMALLVGSVTVASADGRYRYWAHDDDDSKAKVYGLVIGNKAKDYGSERENEVTGSFQDTDGILTVQQNEGSNNELGVANAVQAEIESNDDVEANAYVRQKVKHNGAVAKGGERSNEVDGASFDDVDGVSSIQQNTGDNNALGIANAIHGRIDDRMGDSDSGDVEQKVVVDQYVGDNTGVGRKGRGHGYGRRGPGPMADEGQDRSNTVDDSYNGFDGIENAQQNNGNGNALGIANSVVTDVGGAGRDDDVSQRVSVTGKVKDQSVSDYKGERSNAIEDSFNGFVDGIVNVQQNNGDGNVLGIGNAVMANVGLGREPEELNNDVEQKVEVTGHVSDVKSEDVDTRRRRGISGDRRNTVEDSFGDDQVEGIVSLQQNNGSNNVLGIGSAVAANIDIEVDDLNGEDEADKVTASAGGKVFDSESSTKGVRGELRDATNRRNLVDDSFDNFSGVFSGQQNNGDGNVHSIANAIAASVNSDDKFDSADAVAKTEGYVGKSEAEDLGGRRSEGTNRSNRVTDSFGSAEGVMSLQQNNGSNSVLAVANTVVANIGNDDTEAEGAEVAALGQAKVWGNKAKADGYVDRANSLSDVFTGAQGIVSLQQNNGANNVMGIANAVVADLNENPAEGWGPEVEALSSVSAKVIGNYAFTDETRGSGGYSNTINDSAFNGFSGIVTVQQNNGSNNAMQTATSVTFNGNF